MPFRSTVPVLLAAMLAVPAMAQETQPAAEGTVEGAAPAAAAEDGGADSLSLDTVVATAGGTAITLGEVIAVRQSLPQEYQQLPDEVLLQALVSQLADQTLMEQAARAAGLTDSRGFEISVRNQQRAVLADMWATRRLLELVNEEAVNAAYEARYVNMAPVEQMNAAHILVETEEEARNIRKQIADGADFAALAARFGIDGTAQRGGDLGWFSRTDMVPAFTDAVFAMEPGALSEPIETPFGWHIIQAGERRTRPVPDLAAVEAEIVQSLTEQAQKQILEEIRTDGAIERPDTDFPAAAIRNDALLSD